MGMLILKRLIPIPAGSLRNNGVTPPRIASVTLIHAKNETRSRPTPRKVNSAKGAIAAPTISENISPSPIWVIVHILPSLSSRMISIAKYKSPLIAANRATKTKGVWKRRHKLPRSAFVDKSASRLTRQPNH